MKRLLPVLLALAVPALAHAQAETWTIDPAHTLSSFTVRHLVISNVRGEFGKTTGTVKLDDKDVTRSSVEATIDVTTLNTRVPDRDAHLKSPDFFDVAKYPTITFKSTRVEKIGEGKLKVTGDLTMKGVTKPVVLEVLGPTSAIKDPTGGQRRGLVATTMVNRRDYGLNWSKTVEAGPVVGDEVKIEIEAELVKAAPKQAGK
ncbi:YceI family protein [Anaeromyxobacter dehalogenans 2CP-1]|uniref:YceI family protein n=1 Tax=Anaeromyxobacter dehalogenans (strain ATCC BAA-258 / DSM 21875 / 2CP-1) TaxID=455488 RepID=B8J8K2_ANAD2|nr:YceI family protein [Anaeromyxobacter dehalogenans]ACL67288.1 YceI family protein [Anaeromyxobacter dehalogenans 2CP-1]